LIFKNLIFKQMKNIYPTHRLMALLALFCCFSTSLLAQVTQPTPQEVPFTQDFSTLALIYPAGFQGEIIGTAAITSYVTSDGTANKDLVNGTASSSSGAIYNYNGKIGFLNSGSGNFGICLALNTETKYGIEVTYDAMSIRNLGTKLNEMVLQYRVGESPTTEFVSLPETAYQNNNTVQTSAVTDPQNLKTIKVVLPDDCNNKAVVQIRWISKDVSGTGGRTSFAIDNISIQSDLAAPINVAGYPKIDNILTTSFDFSAQINEKGKIYYVLLAGGSEEPSIDQIKSGQDASGNPALQADFLTITNASLVSVKNIMGLSGNTSYTLYSISEDNYNHTQSVINKIDATTSNAPVPSLITTKTALDFGPSEQNFDSNTLSYQVQATDINSSVSLTATGNYSISKEANTNFQTTLTFDQTDFDLDNKPTVYVRFTPNNIGNFSGQITHQSSGATDKIVTLSGIGINPYIQNFNDANVLSNSGWKAYSVAGDKIKWVSTSSRFNSSPRSVQINGYSEVGASKDWLISPKLRLDSFTEFPILSFYSRKFYAGSTLKLMVSVDYDGVSSPETATWTAVEGDFPTITGVFKQSNYINLAAYKTNHTYLAWVYETITNDGDNSAEWTLDDISITNATNFLASNPILNFGDTAPNTISDSQSFAFSAGGYGDFAITAPADYQLSVDNLSFQSSLTVTEADALLGKTIYARFAPSTKALNISGSLTIIATGLNQQIGLLTGSSWPKTETFDIVSYNLEFFGSDVKDTSNSEFGPIDDALQIENVAKVMNRLNADVYVVQEVSDDPSLDILIQKLNINGKTFDKTISPAWSYSFDTPDPNFPPQKLVVLYNTQTVTVKNTSVMFSELYNNIRAGNTTLPNYPGGNSNSFFASGRLPYMVEIETNIGGIKKDITVIDIHARANSGNDLSRYNMRKYDAEYLKNNLDINYPNTNFMILGDYNDDVKSSVIVGQPSSYEAFVNDATRYNPLTLGISNAGAYSFLSSGGFLDHIVVSNELTDEYIPNSIMVYDPRTDISNYTNTTSDHGPVIARFELKSADPLSILDPKINTGFTAKTYPNPATNTVNVLIKTNNDKNLKLNLYDINGRLISNPLEIKGSVGENTIPLNIGQLQSGIYIYTLTENNKIIFRDKIIKK
jgi:trimeric autotransporter adhesin